MTATPFLDADALAAAVPWRRAVDILAAAARTSSAGSGVARSSVAVGDGELLLMPAVSDRSVGVKLVGVAPGNPSRGLPRIQATYVLFDAATMTPVLIIDGTALTVTRTAAISAVAVQHLAPPEAERLVVFGTGPQADGHVHAIRAVRPVQSVRIVGRRPSAAAGLVGRLAASGVDASVGEPGDVATADIVVCATSAAAPVFTGSLLGDGACVVAIGSHQPTARELDADVFRRAATVVVEDRATALREAGDVIMAMAEGALNEAELTCLGELAEPSPSKGISVFKSVGMAWQDLVVAETAALLAGYTGP